tara:strand:- start:178 stop:330 length:153 start_codon:yes stop_codon:yes gene_type:complete
MDDTIAIFDGPAGTWKIDGRWTEYCVMLIGRGVPLTRSFETIRDLMLAGF